MRLRFPLFLPMLLLFALLAPTAARSAPVTEHRGGGPAQVSGVYSVTFNLTIASTLPAGATITCKAQIVPSQTGFMGLNSQAAIPVETATGVATVTGSTATCAVEIPFSWTVNGAQNGASLSYEIDAVNISGSLPVLLRTSAQQGVSEAYPATGATSNLSFNVTF